MKAERVWVVSRPVGKQMKPKAAYFSLGAARQACVPNYKDAVSEAWLVTEVPEGEKALCSFTKQYEPNELGKHEARAMFRCNLPRKPAKHVTRARLSRTKASFEKTLNEVAVKPKKVKARK